MKLYQLFFFLILFMYQNDSFSYPKINVIKANSDYLLITENSLPIIDIGINFSIGSTDDKGIYGLTNLAFESLSRIKYGDEKVINLFESMGAEFSYDVGKDFSTMKVRFINNKENIHKVTTLLNFIFRNRQISENDLEFLKEKIKNRINSQLLNPGSLARIKANEKFFIGTDYSHPIVGHKKSIALLTTANVVGHLDKIFTKKSIGINLVGNISENESAHIIHKMLNNVSKGIGKIKEKSKIKFNGKMYLQKISMASKQTHIYIVIPAVSRVDKDYYNLLIANYIFGGSGFGSKLFNEIRQKRGLAYSVYSYLRPYNDFGLLIINMQTENKNAKSAINILKNEIYKIKKDIFTKQEIENAKEGILGDFYIRYDTNKKMLNLLTQINYLNFELDYFKNYENEIKKVTKEKIHDAIQKYIFLEKSIITTVGNF